MERINLIRGILLYRNTLTTVSEEEKSLLRPKLMIVNLIIMLATVVALLEATWEPALIFMVALSVALIVNYPNVNTQMERIKVHAPSALSMASVILAKRGIFRRH